MYYIFILLSVYVSMPVFSMESDNFTDKKYSFEQIMLPVVIKLHKISDIERRDKCFDDIGKKLQKYPEFTSAFKFNREKYVVEIFLPKSMVKAIFTMCGYDLVCIDKNFIFPSSMRSFIDNKIPCVLSYSEKLKEDVKRAWVENNKVISKNIHFECEPIYGESENYFNTLFSFIFDVCNYKGVVIGENHADFFARCVLCNIIPDLGEMKVKKIYAEFIPIQLQDIVDQYIDSEDSKMPIILSAYLDFAHKIVMYNGDKNMPNDKYTYKKILKTAKKYRIRVHAIDDARYMSLADIKYDDKKDRTVVMNQFAVAQYKAINNNDERCIFYCGQGHSTTLRTESGETVAGIQDILGFPAIFMYSYLLKSLNKDTGIYFNDSPQFKAFDSSSNKYREANFEAYYRCK